MPDGDSTSAGLWFVAERLADAAREETLRHFRARNLVAESKSEPFDPVTVADRNAEALMRTALEELRPEDGILGEEFGPKRGTSGLTWVLDPVDGTRGFISGTPTWGVLIALSDDSGPLLGLIDQPYVGERFMGGRGRAILEGPHGSRPLGASGTTSLAAAKLFTTFPEVGTSLEAAAFRRVADEVRLTRYGCDCYAYALLAAGHVDLVIEAGLEAYDIHAPIAVVEAAGGIVTDWEGRPAHGGGRVLAAATRELHESAMELLGPSPQM